MLLDCDDLLFFFWKRPTHKHRQMNFEGKKRAAMKSAQENFDFFTTLVDIAFFRHSKTLQFSLSLLIEHGKMFR